MLTSRRSSDHPHSATANGIRRINTSARQGTFDDSTSSYAPLQGDVQATANQREVAATDKEQEYVSFGCLRFNAMEIDSVEAMSAIPFYKGINADVKIGTHMYSRLAVVKLSETGREVALFVDRSKASPDEVDEVANLLENSNYLIAHNFFATSTLIISISQGHLNGDILRSARDIARDPAKNALFQSFTDIVGWAYDNKADDIDFALDITRPMSQVAFKIGGRYIRPAQYLMNSDTMSHILGIAWQRSGGGASAQFDIRIEQQAQITLELPRVEIKRPNGARVRLRWSGMANDKGTVVTMRLQRLGESALVKSLDQAGYLPYHMNLFRRVINSEGGLVCFSGVVGSGKSTSLAQMLSMLPHHVKIQSIEDPVELEIARAYQKTVSRDLANTGPDQAFLSAARAIYRSALDVLYLGEVRDVETGGIARQVVESGHTVYTTTHARSALGVVDRFVSPQIGIPRDVLGAPDIIKLLVYQALLPVNCPHCKLSPSQYEQSFALSGSDLEHHRQYWERIERLYGVNREQYRMRDHRGCPHCRKEGLPDLNGLNGRTVVCEMVEPDEEMLGYILEGRSLALQQYWRSLSNGKYDSEDLTGKTAMECAIFKGTRGEIDPREIEARFTAFETVEAKQMAARETRAAVSRAQHGLRSAA